MAKTVVASAPDRNNVPLVAGDIIRPYWGRGNWTLYRIVELYESPDDVRRAGQRGGVAADCVVVLRNNGVTVRRGQRRYKFYPGSLEKVTEESIAREIAAKQEDLNYRVNAVMNIARGLT